MCLLRRLPLSCAPPFLYSSSSSSVRCVPIGLLWVTAVGAPIVLCTFKGTAHPFSSSGLCAIMSSHPHTGVFTPGVEPTGGGRCCSAPCTLGTIPAPDPGFLLSLLRIRHVCFCGPSAFGSPPLCAGLVLGVPLRLRVPRCHRHGDVHFHGSSSGASERSWIRADCHHHGESHSADRTRLVCRTSQCHQCRFRQ